MEKLMKALKLRKSKYLKRTGSPGHYKYEYKQPAGKEAKSVSEMRGALKRVFPAGKVGAMSDKAVKEYYRAWKSDPKVRGAKTVKDIVANRAAKLDPHRLQDELAGVEDVEFPRSSDAKGFRLNFTDGTSIWFSGNNIKGRIVRSRKPAIDKIVKKYKLNDNIDYISSIRG